MGRSRRDGSPPRDRGRAHPRLGGRVRLRVALRPAGLRGRRRLADAVGLAVPVRRRAHLGFLVAVRRIGARPPRPGSPGDRRWRSVWASCTSAIPGRTTPRSRPSRRRWPALIVYLYPAHRRRRCRSGSAIGCRAGGRGSPWASRSSASSWPSVASTRRGAAGQRPRCSPSPRASSTRSGSSSPRGSPASDARPSATTSGRRRFGDRRRVALMMTATAASYWVVGPRDRPTGAARPDPGGGLGRAHRRRRRRDVHRDPDVLRGRPAGRRGAGLAHRHGRADLDDRPRGDPVLGRPDADPARRRRVHPGRRGHRPDRAGAERATARSTLRVADE